jgi:hypothetical protein
VSGVTHGMVTHRELLSDSIYAKWFATPPKAQHEYLRWRVYAQKKAGKRWQKKDFLTWEQAFKFFRRHQAEWYNASLTCRNEEWRPPVVKYQGKRQYLKRVILMEAHRWCGYCRRPTMFGYFTKHHAFPKGGIQPKPGDRRCGICGIREVAVKTYY